jgi:hypothetical protein
VNRDVDPLEPEREGNNVSASVQRGTGQPRGQDTTREKSLQPRVKSMDREASAPRSPNRARLNDHALLAQTGSQRAVLSDLGRFRTVALSDIAAARYEGQKTPLDRDLRILKQQGLVRVHVVSTGRPAHRIAVATLTAKGREVATSFASDHGQRLYNGFVKPSEVAHDAAIYRMYQAEERQLYDEGARVKRVVLDYEIKHDVYRPLAKTQGLPESERAEKKAAIAQENGLKVIEGKILLPDLRIEYETREGEVKHIDLELATHHYRGSQIRGKAAAGFKMYAPSSSAGRLSAALQDPRIAAEIHRL